MRKFIIALLLLLGVIFVIGKLTELQSIAETLQRAAWPFLALAAIAQFTWMWNQTASFRAIYRALGISESYPSLFLMAAAANFTNVIAPSAGMGGMAIFISEATRRKYSPARATVAGAVYVLFDYLGFLCVLALGIIVLIRRDDLSMVEITASALFTFAAVVLTTLLFLGMRSAQALGKALAGMARLANRVARLFSRRPYVSEQRAYEFAHDAAEGLRELRHNPRGMLLPALLALTNKTFMMLILLSSFLAFQVPVSIGTVIAGFSTAYLFTIVSPTPAGIGFVEGSLTLALSSMYVPLSDAALITLVYRAATFWLPLLFGMLALRLIEHTRPALPLPAESEAD